MKIRPRVPIGLPIAAVVLLVLGFVARSAVPSIFGEEQLAGNVLLAAIPFVLIFVAIILAFIIVIWLIASVLNNNVSSRLYRPIEAVIIGGIAVGIFAMMQPWSFVAYRIGFHV